MVSLPNPLSAALLLAALILFTTLAGTPNITQSLYWQVGMCTKIAPLVLGTLNAGLLLHLIRRARSRPIPWYFPVLLAALAFLCGGFSETYALLQTVVWCSALPVCSLVIPPGYSRRATLWLVASCATGSFTSLGVMAFAPGNAVRQSRLYPPGTFSQFWQLPLRHAFNFVTASFCRMALPLVLSIVIPALIALESRTREGWMFPNSNRGRHESWRRLGIIPCAGVVLVIICMLPACHTDIGGPPERDLVIAAFVLACACVCWGYSAGALAAASHTIDAMPKAAVLLAGCVSVLLTMSCVAIRGTARIMGMAPGLQAYAAAWDKRDKEIRAAKRSGTRKVNVRILRCPAGLDDLCPDPMNWVNRDAACCYGLESITAR
jgi:hypothetical protein